ncbi:YybH family protein [Haloferax sp. YSMS24]|uniref:YybH family protein n=1 Tax=unclassified Haloferax TaxID=2625095 RepID=UPI00398D2306
MAIKQTEDEVGAVSDRFYDALTQMANGDAKPMLDLWPHNDYVSTMHPIGGREVGWDEVKGPWQAVADMAAGGEVRPSDRYIRVVGDAAYELVTENVTMSLGTESIEGAYRATNVYQLEDGEWNIVHHHSDIAEEFIEIVQRLGGGE